MKYCPMQCRAAAQGVTGCRAVQINTLGFSVDGKRLATGSADHTIKIWKVDDQSIAVRALGAGGRACSGTRRPSAA